MSGAALHGWLILDKPVGLGSTQAVAAVKRALRQGGYARVKVGHGGTLDPLASGVLPVALGEATKLGGRMLDADKAYEFTIAFGTETDTLDAEGEVVTTSAARPTLAEVEAVLPRFTGPIRQMPPAYSALKVDGRRAYDLARAGAAVALAERAVTIHSLLSSPARGGGPSRSDGGGGALPEPTLPPAPDPFLPGDGVKPSDRAVRQAARPLHHPAVPGGSPPRAGEEVDTLTLTAMVSKGTYIRSLARDIARALGTVGHVTMLRRVKAGPFTLERAISLDLLDQAAKAQALQELLLPLTAGLDDIPVLGLTPDQALALRQGRALAGIAAPPGLHLAMLGAEPVALVEAGETIRVVRGFNPMSEGRA